MKKLLRKKTSALLFAAVVLSAMCGGCSAQTAGETPETVSDQTFSTEKSITAPIEPDQSQATIGSSETLKSSSSYTQEAEYHQIESERAIDISGSMLLSSRGDDISRHELKKSYDRGNSIGLVSVRDGVFLGMEFGLDLSRVTFALDVTQEQDKTVILDDAVMHYNPRQLDNGLIAIGSDFSRKKLLNPDGTPSPVTLDFNYGVELDNIMATGGHDMEYRMECVTYDTKNARYVTAFSRSTFFKSEDQQGTGPVGIAVFNAEGRQLDWFMLDGVETTQLGKQSRIGPFSDLFMLENGNVLFSDPEGSGPVAEGKYDDMGINAEINLKTHEFETFENDEVEERYGETDNLCLSDAMFASARKKQPPCPLIVEYAPDGTHVYKRDKNKTLIQTLGKEYKLEIYAVDLDETCYLLFIKDDSKNS